MYIRKKNNTRINCNAVENKNNCTLYTKSWCIALCFICIGNSNFVLWLIYHSNVPRWTNY